MIKNAVTIAENKLRLHFENGEMSSLSIIEVAELMDIVTFGYPDSKVSSQSIFFQFSQN